MKESELGMPFGTACHRLRKLILFELIKETKRDNCFRCGKKIETLEDLTIDHKEAWRHSENPIEKFFDLNNIAFSHWKCNTDARRIPRKYSPEEALKIKRERQAAYMRENYSTEKRRIKKLLTGH